MNHIDLSDVADVLKPGDEFDVVTLTPEGVEIATGKAVAETSAVGQNLVADLEARMAAFHDGAQQIVNSPEWRRERGYIVPRARTQRTVKSKAKFKAQRKARKAQRRK